MPPGRRQSLQRKGPGAGWVVGRWKGVEGAHITPLRAFKTNLVKNNQGGPSHVSQSSKNLCNLLLPSGYQVSQAWKRVE